MLCSVSLLATAETTSESIVWGSVAEWAAAGATFAAVVVALWISHGGHKPSLRVTVGGPERGVSTAEMKTVTADFVTIRAANTGPSGISLGVAGLQAWPPKDKSETLFLIARQIGHEHELPGRVDVFGARQAHIDWQTVKELRSQAPTAWWWPFEPRMIPFVNLDSGGQVRGRAIPRRYFR